MKIFICEICKRQLGKIWLDKLSVPMQPNMFHSLNSDRGFPLPFRPFQSFNEFRCGQCKARPFKTHNHITCLDDKGFYVQYNIDKIGIEQKIRKSNQDKINEIFGEEHIEKPTPISKFQDSVVDFFKKKREPILLVCDKCGKEYKRKGNLDRHKAKCNG